MRQLENTYTQTKETQSSITPEMAIEILRAGNDRFIMKKTVDRDLHSQTRETAGGQYPFAAVLSCIDSRVPAELVFDQGIGDIFNVRIAGNFANNDILGSLEFACKVAGAKAILVLGHTHCGAVKGACDDVRLGNLTSMLDNLMPAVDAVEETKDRSSENTEFVQKVAEKNVSLTMEAIRRQSEILRELELNNEILIAGGMYDVETGKVKFI